MARRALGRGLSALFSDSSARAGGLDVDQADELIEVELDLIEPNPEQPRTDFSAEKLEELASSIRANGVVQPVLLRRIGDGRFQLVAGERRWRAARSAGLQRLPAVIRQIPDGKLLEFALIENIQRQELNPIEEAQAYQRLIENLGLTQETVAAEVGKDRSSIANYLRLLKLPLDIQNLLETDRITMGHARALLGVESVERQRELAGEIIARGLSVRETEEAVKTGGSAAKVARRSTATQNDANIRAAELRMKRLLGAPVRIQFGRKGGKIVISFGSASDLDRIYSLILRKPETAASPETAL